MAAPRKTPQLGDRTVPDVDWRGVGLRRTPQREVVLGLVRSTMDHPTAEWIHREARLAISDISLGTVYRTLRILKEKGLIYEFSGGAGPSRYDGTRLEHEHVRCVCCGKVVDVDVPEMGDLRRQVADLTGFHIGQTPMLFQGLCDPCAAGGSNGHFDEKRKRRVEDESKVGPPGDLDRDWIEGHW